MVQRSLQLMVLQGLVAIVGQAHAQESLDADDAEETDWRAENRGPGFYGTFMMGPHYLDEDLSTTIQDTRRWGFGMESGFQFNQWLFGGHIWGNTFDTFDEADPLRLAFGLNIGKRIPLTRSFALRLGGAWQFNSFGACADGPIDPDIPSDLEDVSCRQPDTRAQYAGTGFYADALVAWTAVGTYPTEGARSVLDVYTGVRYNRLQLDNDGSQSPIDGGAVVWLMGFSIHMNAFR
ncbi:MAG: hypothetical protein AAFV53_16125 [Myxococcota bacterium]